MCIILERIQWNEYYYFHSSGGTRLRWSSYRHYCVCSGVGGGGMSIMLQHACYFLAEKIFEQKLTTLTRIWIVTFRIRHKEPSTDCIHAYWCLLWEFYGVGTSCTVNLPRPYLAFPNLGTFALPGTTGAPFSVFSYCTTYVCRCMQTTAQLYNEQVVDIPAMCSTRSTSTCALASPSAVVGHCS